MDKIVHFEIPFDDKKRAMKFYSDVFGWKLTDMAEMSYVMAETVAIDDRSDAERAGCDQWRPFRAPERGAPPRRLRRRGVRGSDAQEGPGSRRQGRDAQDAHPRHGRVCARDRYRRQRHRPVRRDVKPRIGVYPIASDPAGVASQARDSRLGKRSREQVVDALAGGPPTDVRPIAAIALRAEDSPRSPHQIRRRSVHDTNALLARPRDSSNPAAEAEW